MLGLLSRRALLAIALASPTTGCVVTGRPGPLNVVPPAPTLLWTVPLAGWGRPAVRGDSVYAMSRVHELVSLDKTTGVIRWRRPLPLVDGIDSNVPMGSVVESTNNTVIVGDYDVMALNRRTGRLLWRFSPEDGYAPGVYLGVVTDDSVYTGSPGGRLHAIDTSNGHSRWSLPLNEGQQTTVYQPIVDRGIVLAGFSLFGRPTRGGVVAADARTGVERWRAHFPARSEDAGERSTAWAGGPVTWKHLVIAAASTGSIYALDRRTGSPVLSVASPHAADVPQDFRPMVVTRDCLVVGTLTGLVVAYRLPLFRERWRYSPTEAGSVLFGMTAAGNSVVVPYAGGRLVGLDLKDGHVRWTAVQQAGLFAWPPAIDSRQVFTVGKTSVAALRTED